MKTFGARQTHPRGSPRWPALPRALAADLPSPEEYQANWPRFRGPDGGGVCRARRRAGDLRRQDRGEHRLDGPRARGGIQLAGGVGRPRVSLRRRRDQMRGDVFRRGVRKTAVGERRAEDRRQPRRERRTCPTNAAWRPGPWRPMGSRVYAMFANGDLAAFDFDGKRGLGEIPRRSEEPATATPPRCSRGRTA